MPQVKSISVNCHCKQFANSLGKKKKFEIKPGIAGFDKLGEKSKGS
jgi:hypothetical protein